MRLTERFQTMTSDTAPTRKPQNARAALTPRQVALVVPHATAVAGADFESATETLSSDLTVHKLWQGEQRGKRTRRTRKAPAAS
jgi:hypothetical protein